MAATVISVDEVRGLALTVFDMLKATGIEHIEIDQPMYWSVFPADIFSVEQPSLVLSDIPDDLDDLHDETSDPESSLALGSAWHALHHLAGVFSAMAAGTLNVQGHPRDSTSGEVGS